MKFNRLLVYLVPFGLLISSCSSSSVSTTTTVDEPEQYVNGYEIKPDANLSYTDLSDADLTGTKMPDGSKHP